jgi:hypothetical protein
MGVGVFFDDGVLCFKVRMGVGVFFDDGVLCLKARVGVGVFFDGDSSSVFSKTLSEDIFFIPIYIIYI